LLRLGGDGVVEGADGGLGGALGRGGGDGPGGGPEGGRGRGGGGEAGRREEAAAVGGEVVGVAIGAAVVRRGHERTSLEMGRTSVQPTSAARPTPVAKAANGPTTPAAAAASAS